MARRKKKDSNRIIQDITGTIPEEVQLEAIVAEVTEEDMIEAGWIFLKMKGDKKVYVKDAVRKQL